MPWKSRVFQTYGLYFIAEMYIFICHSFKIASSLKCDLRFNSKIIKLYMIFPILSHLRRRFPHLSILSFDFQEKISKYLNSRLCVTFETLWAQIDRLHFEKWSFEGSMKWLFFIIFGKKMRHFPILSNLYQFFTSSYMQIKWVTNDSICVKRSVWHIFYETLFSV